MDKPLLYDVFCGAGGATKGYQRAGFRVIGIDNKPQKHYCGDGFILMDALEFLDRYNTGEFERAAACHASPPCQRYSNCTPMRYRANHSDLIAIVRNKLNQTGKPYVIENVENARRLLINPVKLCGSAFGLNIRRHRYFEIYPPLFPLQSPCDHSRPIVYVSGSTGSSSAKFHRFDFTVAQRREAMGTPWMTDSELDEAIPPIYTEYIGKYLMQEVMTLGRSK